MTDRERVEQLVREALDKTDAEQGPAPVFEDYAAALYVVLYDIVKSKSN